MVRGCLRRWQPDAETLGREALALGSGSATGLEREPTLTIHSTVVLLTEAAAVVLCLVEVVQLFKLIL